MKLSYTVLMIAGSAVSLCGQNTFSGPFSGYVFDTAMHSIRAIQGLPGAAYLSTVSGPSWDMVSVAPNGSRALAVSGLWLNLIPDLSQPGTFTPIEQIPAAISRMAWSSDSKIAAIWSSGAGEMQRISDLDSTPVVHASIDLDSLGGVLSGWNLSPDGNYIAMVSGGTNGVYISDQDDAPVMIASVSQPGATAFSADGSTVFVFSAEERQIEALSRASGAVVGNFDATSFEEDASGSSATATGRSRESAERRRTAVSRIQDLATSADGARLYAIGGETLCSFDFATWQTVSCTTLQTSPASFQPMPAGILMLNYARPAGLPLWVLDSKAGKLYFIPSGSAADASL